MSDRQVLDSSHSFVLRTEASVEIDIGPVVNQLLTARRDQERDVVGGVATPASVARAEGFAVGVRVTIFAVFGADGAYAFECHCQELWERAQQDGLLN